MYSNSETVPIADNLMKLVTPQLGEIVYMEDTLINFTNGIIGFENYRRFILVDNSDFEPFRWLFTVEREGLGLPILNPLKISSEFHQALPPRLMKRILTSGNMMEIFCVVNLNGESGRTTINLKSPIIIDFQEKSGRQLILESDKLSVAHPIW